jgi:hypothetical protein
VAILLFLLLTRFEPPRTFSGRDRLRSASSLADEFAQDWKEKGLAETTNRGFRLNVEGVSDDVTVEFVQNNPETSINIETGAALSITGISTAKLPLPGCLVVIWKNNTSPSRLAILTPTATGRSLRPSVSPLSASRLQR